MLHFFSQKTHDMSWEPLGKDVGDHFPRHHPPVGREAVHAVELGGVPGSVGVGEVVERWDAVNALVHVEDAGSVLHEPAILSGMVRNTRNQRVLVDENNKDWNASPDWNT